MSEKRPVLITYVRDLNFLNAFLLIVSLFPKFTERFGIYSIPTLTFSDGIIRVLMVIILLIISYGFLRLKRWGFWLMITYDIFFLVLPIILLLKQNGQSYYAQGLIPSVLGLLIALPTKQYFTKKIESS
ncbi:hypothetical protein G9F72_008165 [Clostridium estertheticum]|uniref:hypothetical protein n=1 Tax=Clostridium estertheticum TaxID=238834 RepID=UPI0013E90F42|nr:hypothetical protein [Clostridium estertheticum]MBZ9686303.1 hypothetical protein [Clostridium estertheticum]